MEYLGKQINSILHIWGEINRMWDIWSRYPRIYSTQCFRYRIFRPKRYRIWTTQSPLPMGPPTNGAPYQWGLLRVVSMWIFFSSWQGWEFVHDKIYNCIFKVRITCIEDYLLLLLLLLFLNLFLLKKEE